MFTRDDVAHLVHSLHETNFDPPVEIDRAQFGLAAYLFDPLSGQIITLAQPHRVDVGQREILLSPMQAAHAVAAARQTHLLNIRAQGFTSLDHFNQAQEQASASRKLAHEQSIERAKLDEEQAEAKVKLAADAAPKREPAEEPETV